MTVTARPGAVLEADGLGKYFGGREVLKAAAFHAVEGSITALLGRNGAGKTTMFRIAVGRVRPERGRVAFRGIHRPRPGLARLAREGLMYSAQESALTPHFTVRAHLTAFRRIFGGAIGPAIERMRLGELLDRRPPTLSGGERQRTSMALALSRRPLCFLCDEPFAGVAPRDRPLVADALRELRERGCAVVVSGHDVEDLFAVADEVIWVTAGTSHWLGPPAAASRHGQFRREYLGPGRGVVSPPGPGGDT